MTELLEQRHGKNPKKHELEKIALSILRFGFTAPIMVDDVTSTIVAGHGRLAALQMLIDLGPGGALHFAKKHKLGGITWPPKNVETDEASVWLVPTLHHTFASAEERDAYVIADNRLTEIGGWDEDALREMLEPLKGGSLASIGYTPQQVRSLFSTFNTQPGGRKPSEKKSIHDKGEIKQVVLYFASSEYDAVVERLNALGEKYGTESNTETVLRLMEHAEAEL